MIKLTKGSFVNLLALAALIYLGSLSAKTINKNYQLRSQIDGLQVQINQLSSEKDELNYLVKYYQTDAFKEKEARAKLGLQQPGENVIILPKSQGASTTDAADTQKATKKSNFTQWMEFLFG